VTFTPSAAGTESSGNVVVQDNAGAQAIGVSGNGIAVGSGGVAFVQVQNNLDTNASNLHTSFSLPITTNPGDLLVAFCRESSNGTDNFTVTDSAGESWTVVYFNYESCTGPRIGMFYMANSAAVTSVTVRYITSGGVIKPGIMVMELSPASGSPALDGAANGGATSTTISTSGSLTTFNANDILIFATDTAANQVPNANTSGGWMAGPGYAIPSNNLVIGASGSNQRMAMQFKIVSSTQSALKTSMTYANSAWNGNIFAAFK